MCGIAGIIGRADTDRLKAMADALRHRGPDDEGYWTLPDATVGLAHRRLSIIDPEGGHQPMANEDGQVLTVFNGVIYNYRELRDDLQRRGHVFCTNSDTETIVHLYEEDGVDFPGRLRGMFAIALWDQRSRQLLLARDRAGVKPLYYGEDGDELLFASEIKAITAAMGELPALDFQALSDYLSWGVVPQPATIYRSIRSLMPGEVVVARDGRIVERRRYWTQRIAPKITMSRDEAVEMVDAALREAVGLRLRSDVPVGAFLSGGIDSGIVTAMAASQYPCALTTVTIGFDDGSFDERPLARLVADRYGTQHHEVLVKPDLVNDIETIVRAYDQPNADSSAIPSFYVARAARRFVKVVLNGDGGDEVFAGYRRHVAARLSGAIGAFDTDADRTFWGGLSRMLPTARSFRSPYAFAHRFVRGMAIDPASRYMAWSLGGFTEAAKRELAGRHGDWLDGVEPSDRFAKRILDDLPSAGQLDRMLATDFATVLPFDFLVKMDIACMAHGLEARSPLLDHELIDLASRFPEAVKLGGVTTKPILRDLAARYVPKPVRTAPKRGFEVPLVRWLREDLRALRDDVLYSRDGLIADLFDRTAVTRLIEGGQRLDPARWARAVWTLVMLGMWDRCG